MPGRNISMLKSCKMYRFSFNGQERDDEITNATGSHNTALFWEYDTRLGRRWNLDPKPQIGISDYAAFGNNPIWFKDPFGNEFDKSSKKLALSVAKKAENRATRLEKKAGIEKNEIIRNDLNARASELRKRSREIKEMDENTNFVFHINQSQSNVPETLPTVDERHININSGGDMASLIHEMKHGYQIITGALQYTRSPGSTTEWTAVSYGVNDELEAHRAEYSFWGQLTLPEYDPDAVMKIRMAELNRQPPPKGEINITNINQITPELISRIGEGKGRKRENRLYRINMPGWNEN